MRKPARIAAVAVALSLLSVPAAAAPIKVRYAHWGMNVWIDSIVKGFNKSQTKYEVIYEKPGDFVPKILTSMAGGSAPTMFSTGWWCGLGSWMKRGLLMDMNPYIAQEKGFNIGEIPAFLRQGGQYEGHTYAFPFEDIGANCVWYNNTMMKNAGLDKPRDNWTVQDFIDYATKLTKDKNGDGKLDQWGMNDLSSWYEARVTAQVLTGGGLYYSFDRKSWTGDSVENVRGLQLIADLARKYKVTGGPGLESGKMGMAIRDACLSHYVNVAKGKYEFDVAAPPAIDESGKRYPQDMQGTFLSIARNAKKREAAGAWEFIKYWTGDDGVKTALSSVGWLQRPPARRPLAAKYYTKPEDKIFAPISLSNFVKWETTAVTAENWPLVGFDKITETLQTGWSGVIAGKTSVQQFIGTASPKVKLLLKGK